MNISIFRSELDKPKFIFIGRTAVRAGGLTVRK
jgi:hypothetical protein